MTAKELKELLEGVPDNFKVFTSSEWVDDDDGDDAKLIPIDQIFLYPVKAEKIRDDYK